MSEELTDDELKLLELEPDAPPPAESDAEPAAEPAPADSAAPADPAAAEAPDPEFAEFLRSHEGKSPEELAKIAFQQQKRAAAAGFEARKREQVISEVVAKAQQTLEQRKAAIAERRKAFEDQLQNDPDAATRALAQERFDAEERQAIEEAEIAEREARIDSAFELASRAIPDLPKVYPEMYSFGQEMQFSDDELRGIEDGREMVMLYLGMTAAKLMKAGVIDIRGNMIAAPAAAAPSDPRLTAPPAPKTLSTAPARPVSATSTIEQQLAALLGDDDALSKMSDDDLARLTGAL